MAAPQPSTRQRAIALVALLADDHDLGPLALLAEELAGPARALSTPWVSATEEERRDHVAAERVALVGEPTDGSALGRGRPAGLERLVAALEVAGPTAGEVPEGLRALAGGPLGLLAGLTAALLQRAARGEDMAARLLGHAEGASEASPRLAPAIAWIAFALARADAEAEALAATWPRPLARALMAVHGALAHDTTDAEAALERGRLELELASLG